MSVNGIPIRLTDERWQHIVTQHVEMNGWMEAVLEAVAAPDRILAGQAGELLAVRAVEVGKWLVVMYREVRGDGFIITAFFTRRQRSLENRIVVWSPSNRT